MLAGHYDFDSSTSESKMDLDKIGPIVCKGLIEKHGGKVWAFKNQHTSTLSFSMKMDLDEEASEESVIQLMPKSLDSTEFSDNE